MQFSRNVYPLDQLFERGYDQHQRCTQLVGEVGEQTDLCFVKLLLFLFFHLLKF